jgi:hypothetical protein
MISIFRTGTAAHLAEGEGNSWQFARTGDVVTIPGTRPLDYYVVDRVERKVDAGTVIWVHPLDPAR